MYVCSVYMMYVCMRAWWLNVFGLLIHGSLADEYYSLLSLSPTTPTRPLAHQQWSRWDLGGGGGGGRLAVRTKVAGPLASLLPDSWSLHLQSRITPQALSSTLTVLQMLQHRAFRILNTMVPPVSVSRKVHNYNAFHGNLKATDAMQAILDNCLRE